MGMAAVLAVCTMQWITGPAIGPFTATLVGWPIRIFAFLTSFILWFGMDSWPRQTKRVTRAFMALVQIIVGLLLIWWLVSRG
ncbi:hypothetical protein XthCFBP4691_07630 [Xanthomonas theicola]|uniref:Uncharacterized protein n=2 Tax=Xanthomonas theicola TaxID=56464 RepID=A0A2S6ZGK8_9XANT|nr:hypothetical protein XthCFBP4691_07630 [Xanthomonas theicola]